MCLIFDIVLQFSLAGVVAADFLPRNKHTSILRSSKGFRMSRSTYSRELQNDCTQLFDLYIGIEKEKNTGQLGEAILI